MIHLPFGCCFHFKIVIWSCELKFCRSFINTLQSLPNTSHFWIGFSNTHTLTHTHSQIVISRTSRLKRFRIGSSNIPAHSFRMFGLVQIELDALYDSDGCNGSDTRHRLGLTDMQSLLLFGVVNQTSAEEREFLLLFINLRNIQYKSCECVITSRETSIESLPNWLMCRCDWGFAKTTIVYSHTYAIVLMDIYNFFSWFWMNL